MLEGKEIQVGLWLANAGCKIVFRNADAHKLTDGNTSDVLLDGMLFDIKRGVVKQRVEVKKEGNRENPRQGPNFVVDLSTSEIRREDAEVAIAWILEDPESKNHLDKVGQCNHVREIKTSEDCPALHPGFLGQWNHTIPRAWRKGRRAALRTPWASPVRVRIPPPRPYVGRPPPGGFLF